MALSGLGWIDNQWRAVECRRSSAGYWLSVDGAGLFWVAPDGRSIAHAEASPYVDPRIVVQTALGPALILALALQRTWCLHASAVVVGGQVVVFVGESGSGKSTLSEQMGREPNVPWKRVADDILPVALTRRGLDALPRFPQLKLAPKAQPAVDQPERLPIAMIYVLGDAESAGGAVRVEALSPREGTLALVRHTAGGRLFGLDLLAAHLAFCARAAARIPVRRIVFRREEASPPRVQRVIAADLDSLQNGTSEPPGER